jgi:hypothetical protein
VVQQHLHDDPFAHPRGEFGVDDAHDGNVRQTRIRQNVIDACAQREDRPEVGESGERAGPMTPAHGIMDARGIG